MPPAAGGTGVDLAATLEVLAGLGVLQALVEGGAALSGSLVEAGLADRLVTYVAPTMLGRDGRPALDFAGPARIADAARWRLVDVARVGTDVRLDYEPPPPPANGEGRLMFTGIVEELGTVRAVTPNEGGARIEIAATRVLDDAELGASIAVNGCCLTVVELGTTTAGPPTRSPRRSTGRRSARSRAGDPVNLERPVRLADRLGGHLVQGHVDAVGTLRAPRAAARRLHPHGLRRARRGAALRRREGLDHRRRHQPHRRRASTDDALRGRGHPAHPRRHHPGRPAAG